MGFLTIFKPNNRKIKKNRNNNLPARFKNIPNDILELLWFEDGPKKNISGNSMFSTDLEPSSISLSLPVSSGRSTPLGYYPAYRNLTPENRSIYINWLSDITQPIDIGFVFLFYYGLERHLINGNYEEPMKKILLLRKYHFNESFQAYSADAVAYSILKAGSSEDLQLLNFIEVSPPLSFLIKSIFSHDFTAKDIISYSKSVGFTNYRYIKNHPELFEMNLNNEINKSGISILYNLDKLKNLEEAELFIANYSYDQKTRHLAYPNYLTNPTIQSTIFSLLKNAHEATKLQLREKRNKKNK